MTNRKKLRFTMKSSPRRGAKIASTAKANAKAGVRKVAKRLAHDDGGANIVTPAFIVRRTEPPSWYVLDANRQWLGLCSEKRHKAYKAIITTFCEKCNDGALTTKDEAQEWLNGHIAFMKVHPL